MNETRFRRAFLLLLVGAISFAFIAMVWEFVLTILLAATFTGLSYPLYLQLLAGLRNRALSAITTLVLVLVLGLAPLLGVLAVGANEALRMTETVGPRVTQLMSE